MKMKHRGLQQRHPVPAAWKRAEAFGIDVSLLEANLRRPGAERLRQHDAALQTITSLREAVEKKNAKHG
jgi:hypothetical protein